MEDILKALQMAVNLGQAEEAKEPHQAQIDTFMQQEGDLSDTAQEAFENWAMIRLNINRAFRRIGIKPQENWVAKDYSDAGCKLLERVMKPELPARN